MTTPAFLTFVLHNLLRLSLILILVSPRIFTISLTATLSFLWPRNSWNEFLLLVFVIALLITSYMICIIRMKSVGMRDSSGQVYCPLITSYQQIFVIILTTVN